jgi:hypothetical protein
VAGIDSLNQTAVKKRSLQYQHRRSAERRGNDRLEGSAGPEKGNRRFIFGCRHWYYRFLCLCKRHQEIIDTITGKTYFFGPVFLRRLERTVYILVMKQIMEEKTYPHFL